MQLGRYNELSAPISLKKNLSENFTLEFDVATDEFSFRTGGFVRLGLSSYPMNAKGYVIPNSKGTEIEWSIEAGNEDDYNNNNYRGQSKPVIKSTMAGYEGNYNIEYSLREFTNKKTGIHATVKVKNGQASFFINGKQIGLSNNFKQDYCNDCVCKGVPPKTTFRRISFTNTTQNWSPDGKSNEVHVYISNVKITEE